MSEFKTHKNAYDELECCKSCSCEVPLAWFSNRAPYSEENKVDGKHLLCEICANTLIGNHLKDIRDPDYSVALMLAQLGNHLKFRGTPNDD